MKKPIGFVLFFFILSHFVCGQSGLVASAGASNMRTSYSLVNQSGAWNHGWHVGLTTRLGKDFWYGRVGLELHKVGLAGSNRIELFNSMPSSYFIKAPLQVGARLLRRSDFQLRAMGGLMISYTAYIEKNNLGINYNRMRDFTAGLLGSAGIDMGRFVFDVSYEYGISELYTGTKQFADYWYVSAGFFF
ncbi:MAG: hypothetical protein IPM48_08145 [Saprospiraceae bacterium]|nr:hypothetical protein [Saprospiraceae bacterium]